MTLLNLPRAISVPFTGAFFATHSTLKVHLGKVLRLHAGLNNVADEVAAHPALARFVATPADVAQLEPMMPEGGPGPQATPGRPAPEHVGTERQRPRTPVMEEQNEVAAAVAKANKPTDK